MLFSTQSLHPPVSPAPPLSVVIPKGFAHLCQLFGPKVMEFSFSDSRQQCGSFPYHLEDVRKNKGESLNKGHET